MYVESCMILVVVDHLSRPVMVLDRLPGLYGLKYDSATARGLPLYLCSYKLVGSVTITWLDAACIHCYWSCSSAVYTLDRLACYHHSSDSSCIAQWASESGTTSYLVCFTYRVGVPVVCFTSDSPGSAFHTATYGLHIGSEFVDACARHPSL